jgi:hypothetical protein
MGNGCINLQWAVSEGFSKEKTVLKDEKGPAMQRMNWKLLQIKALAHLRE